MEFLLNLLQFVVQTGVIVVGLMVIIGFTASIISKTKDSSELKVKNLNSKWKQYKQSLAQSMLSKKSLKKLAKQQKKEVKNSDSKKPHLFVLDFTGDIKAAAADQFREVVSALLLVIEPSDEVVIRLESPGGMVHGYGFAASQIQRIKDKGIHLTICVDKVAASGGYMMACLADKIVSAPFAIIGSIGVVASLPNFNKILKKNDVEYLEITAGEFKRTLTPLGEITDAGMNKFKSQIEDIHILFKDHVKKHRPQLEMEKVATGEYWYGQQAKELRLVDELGTSDDFILSRQDTHKVLELSFKGKQSLKEKLSDNINGALSGLWSELQNLNWSSRFFS